VEKGAKQISNLYKGTYARLNDLVVTGSQTQKLNLMGAVGDNTPAMEVAKVLEERAAPMAVRSSPIKDYQLLTEKQAMMTRSKLKSLARVTRSGLQFGK
jgi:hypothetical protein